jgi:hypothetical protein
MSPKPHLFQFVLDHSGPLVSQAQTPVIVNATVNLAKSHNSLAPRIICLLRKSLGGTL